MLNSPPLVYKTYTKKQCILYTRYSIKIKFHKLHFEYYKVKSLSRTLQLDIEYYKIQCSNTYKIQETNVDSTNNVSISFFFNYLITRMQGNEDLEQVIMIIHTN